MRRFDLTWFSHPVCQFYSSFRIVEACTVLFLKYVKRNAATFLLHARDSQCLNKRCFPMRANLRTAVSRISNQARARQSHTRCNYSLRSEREFCTHDTLSKYVTHKDAFNLAKNVRVFEILGPVKAGPSKIDRPGTFASVIIYRCRSFDINARGVKLGETNVVIRWSFEWSERTDTHAPWPKEQRDMNDTLAKIVFQHGSTLNTIVFPEL